MPELVEPTVAVRRSFLDAVRELVAEESGSTRVARDLERWSGVWDTDRGFARYVEAVRAEGEQDAPRPPGQVPSTTLWWTDGPAYLGRVSIRHRLTPHLLEVGGHIGYDVRPSARRQGHATAMLAAALPVAARLGIDPALVTCDDTNVGSRRVIEANGGVLEDQRGVKLRYWVSTGPASWSIRRSGAVG